MFLDQFGAAGWPQIWPRGAQIGQKCPKTAISSSGGPKRLEQHGTKVEWVQKLWFGPPPTHSTFVPYCSNCFGPLES